MTTALLLWQSLGLFCILPLVAPFRSLLPSLLPLQKQQSRLKSYYDSHARIQPGRRLVHALNAMKDDPEWTFLDTARIHVKGGDGGSSAGSSAAGVLQLEDEEQPTSRSKRNSKDRHQKSNSKRRGRGKRQKKSASKSASAAVATASATPTATAAAGITTAPAVGGRGGNGGSIYLVCDARLESLVSLMRQAHFVAPNGEDGSMKNRDGSNGSNINIKVPPGASVRELYSQEFLGELSKDGESILLARGGRGGSKTKRQQHGLDSSNNNNEGQEQWLTIEYKISASVGIVGMANSGKSSILAALSNAKPRVADYPFTTTCPNLGVVALRPKDNTFSSNDRSSDDGSELDTHDSDGESESDDAATTKTAFTICDLPGLMEGAASEGAGMGGAFLRHVQNCNVLLHVVDASAVDPLNDFEIINRELNAFDDQTIRSNSGADKNNGLLDKPQVVVLSKCDRIPDKDDLDKLVRSLKQKAEHSYVFPISVMNTESLEQLTDSLSCFL